MAEGMNKRTAPEKEDEKKRARSSLKTKMTGKTGALKNEIEKLTNDLSELKDKYLRTVAEFENYKKRRDREIGDIINRANEEFCLELLPVIDDFERSLNSKAKKKSYKTLEQGVRLIYQKLISVLRKQGIEAIAAVGQPFDPQIHAAILQVDDSEKPSRIVVDEALKGYRLKEKVLRFSQVVVNK